MSQFGSRFSTVFAIFKTRNETQDALDSMMDEGFDASEISILFPENASPQNNLTTTTSDILSGRTVNENLGLMYNPRTIHIPGYSPLIAAGPAMSFLDSIENGDKGWLIQPLLNRGIPEYEAKRYENNVDESGFLLAVECQGFEKQHCAEDILSLRGARYIAATSESFIESETLEHWKNRQANPSEIPSSSKLF